ncbi:hypothetical protein AB1L30_04065 [Bremerella sp. JC817]|uniref:hypothetical protein n=1 Tax=Bremerella sp. JC817 TaxID=3231756 RepID=UPI00345AFF3C
MKKLDLQSGGLKTKLILHVEKLVFGLAILLVAAFVYFGTQQKSITTKPDDLVQAAEKARNNIEKLTWDEVEGERWVPPEYRTAAVRASKPIPLAPYETPSSLRVRHKESIEKRADPKIIPLEKLEVVAGFAPFAYLSSNQAANGGGFMRGEGGGPSMPGAGYDMYSGMSGEGMGGSDANSPPTLTPEQMAMLGSQKGGTGGDIEGKYFVAITGLAPLKRQLDLYNAAFKDRANYIESRDYPKYVHFAVERRTQNPDGSWGEWEKPFNIKQERWISRYRWAFVPDEIAPPEFLDPVLSFPMPPILLFDPDRWGRHSEVPEFEPMDQMAMNEGSGMGNFDEMPMGGIEDFPGVDPGFGMGGSGMEGGYGGPGGGRMPGMGGMPGIGGMPGMGGGRNGYDSMIARPGFIRRPTGTAGVGPGGMMGGGMEGGPGGGSFATSPFDAENKMFRFYDTSVSPHKSYQYRVQLFLEDPNNPQNYQEAPPVRALESSVLARIEPERQKIMKAMQQQGAGMSRPNGQANATAPVHEFWRTTEFSEPSPTVRVPSSADVLAGPVDAGRTIYRQGSRREVMRTAEPTATVLAMRWDPRDVVKALVTKELKDVKRGTTVEYKGDMWVLDPSTYQFKRPWALDADTKDQEYTLKTGYTVLDMRGGDDTAGKYTDENNDKLKTPGEILILDDAGNIHIKTEIDEVKEFTKFNFSKPEVKRTRRERDDPYSSEGGPPGMYDDYGGGEGGSRRRR